MAKFDSSNPDAWIAAAPDGQSLQLIDPLTRKPFEAVPECILAEPELAKGYDFLQNHSENISITVMGVVHDRASSLGPMPDGWELNTFEDFVQSCDYFGYEAFGWNAKRIAMRKQVARSAFALSGFDDWPLFADAYRRQSYEQRVNNGLNVEFVARVMRAAVAYDATPSFPADIRSDGTLLEKNTLELALAAGELPAAEGAKAFIAFNNVREYIAVARMGLALREYENGRAGRPLHAALLFGRAHRSLKDKFEALGIMVDVMQPPGMALTKWPHELEDIYRAGVITPKDAAAFVDTNEAAAVVVRLLLTR